MKLGGKGFFQMKRTLFANGISLLWTAVKVRLEHLNDSFVERMGNLIYCNGGGDGSATLMYRTGDGSKLTQQQKDGILSYLFLSDCKLEASFSDPRSDSDLLSIIDTRNLHQSEIDDASKNDAHFLFMYAYILPQGGNDFLRKTTPPQLFRLHVHSPTLGRKVNVGLFLRSKWALLLGQGQATFAEKELEMLDKIEIREHFKRVPTVRR